jgi:apolipoprotein N-acyltransferase
MISNSTVEVHGNPLFLSVRTIGLTLLSAGLMLLSSPPIDLWPLAFVALVPLYLAIRGASALRAALLGWLCGWAVNVGGYFWGIEVLERFAHLSKGMSIVSVLGVCAYQGVVWLVWAWACNLICRRLRLSWLLVAPLCLAILEAAVPMIFPWYLGFTVWRVWPVLQVAELGGAPAVSALLVLINMTVAEGVGGLLGRRSFARSIKWAGGAVVIVLCLGLIRAAHVTGVRADMPTLKVGIVQPNFGIMSMESRKRHGQRYIEVLRHTTRELGEQGANLVIWPESAFPFLFDRGLKREYAPGHPWELKGGGKVRLVFGALAHPFGESYIYNSAVMVGESGHVVGLYDKYKLLAFAEYIPFADKYPDWAKRMRARLPDWPDIETGRGPRLLVDGNLRIAPFICYEDIFQGFVNQVALKRPNLLVTLANHAWFGDSTAPHQALALATMRSVETRRDLVRATSTGVSSIGDALGRILKEGPLFDVSGHERPSPTLLVGEVTLMEIFALGPYSASLFPYACALALAILVGSRVWRRLR